MRVPARLVAISLALGAAGAAHAEIHVTIDADGALTLSDVAYGRGVGGTYAAPGAAVGVAPSATALPFAALVSAAAIEHGLPEALLHAVICAESNYNPAAVSRRGAIGLMQLMPATARELGVADPRDPAANIRGGAQYLKRLLAMFGDDVMLAVAAYNAGPGVILRSGGIPPFPEIRRYVPRVMAHFRRLQALADPAALAQR